MHRSVGIGSNIVLRWDDDELKWVRDVIEKLGSNYLLVSVCDSDLQLSREGLGFRVLGGVKSLEGNLGPMTVLFCLICVCVVICMCTACANELLHDAPKYV